MSIANSIARTIRRLNLQSIVMRLPIFGQALYEGLSLEFDRVNDFREIVKSATVVNGNMDPDTIQDHEQKYGINTFITATAAERIDRLLVEHEPAPLPDSVKKDLQSIVEKAENGVR